MISLYAENFDVNTCKGSNFIRIWDLEGLSLLTLALFLAFNNSLLVYISLIALLY